MLNINSNIVKKDYGKMLIWVKSYEKEVIVVTRLNFCK